MNSHIANFLDKYIDDSDPRYAVAISGDWGTGKTHFINNWVEKVKANSKAAPDEETAIELKPVSVSLYGMKSIAEVTEAINRELHPILHSAIVQKGKEVIKMAANIGFKANFQIGDIKGSDVSVSMSIDALGLFKSKDKSIGGDKLIVFDDFERAQIDMKELMGYINFFVENSACHVVVVGDFDALKENRKTDFEEFQEKTFGRKFELNPSIEEALDAFINETDIHGWLLEQRDWILKSFLKTDARNLRLLRQSIRSISSILNDTDITNPDSRYLKTAAASYILVANLYHSKEYKEIFRNFYKHYFFGLTGDSDSKKKISELQTRFSELTAETGFNILQPDLIRGVIDNMEKGLPMTDLLLQGMADEERRPTVFQRLANYLTMEDEEFEATIQELSYTLYSDSTLLPGDIGRITAYLSTFAHLGIAEVDKDKLIDKVFSEISTGIMGSATKEDAYGVWQGFIRGLNSYGDTNPTKELLVLDLQEILKEAVAAKPDQIQRLLRNLSDANVEDLETLDNLSAPDGQSAFSLKPILQYEDPQTIFEGICRLSNKGRNTFGHFLRAHYYVDYVMVGGDNNRYIPDRKVLEEIKNLIDAHINSGIKPIAKLSFTELSTLFSQIINVIPAPTPAPEPAQQPVPDQSANA